MLNPTTGLIGFMITACLLACDVTNADETSRAAVESRLRAIQQIAVQYDVRTAQQANPKLEAEVAKLQKASNLRSPPRRLRIGKIRACPTRSIGLITSPPLGDTTS
jgi:uncharacterized protein YlxW (UPF0749 family)